jgi:hypothetical protein
MGILGRRREPKRAPDVSKDDQRVLARLEGRGADLSRARHVVHYLYFPREADARRAADVVTRAGYGVTVEPLEGSEDEWSVRADDTRVVSVATVPAFRRWFEQVAEDAGGTYAGWEAATKP